MRKPTTATFFLTVSGKTGPRVLNLEHASYESAERAAKRLLTGPADIASITTDDGFPGGVLRKVGEIRPAERRS